MKARYAIVNACLSACACALVISPTLCAQVPQIIHYQGRVTVHNVVHQGESRFRFALVNNGLLSFWSNDGTSLQGREPAASLSLQVNKGAYAVALGDTSLPNMLPIHPTVFTNSDIRLRVWFDDGEHGSQRLTPDQRITSVGYAMVAATVAPGGVTSSSLAPGAVASANLAPGAALANLLASGQSVVPAGGIILSREANSASLVAAGYVNVGSLSTSNSPERWEARAAFLSARQQHTAVWIGSRMMIWGGGGNGSYYNNGGSYNPDNNTWQPITAANAPGGRWEHAAVWTGQEMLVWGGRPEFFHSGGNLGDGGSYNPSTDSWKPISVAGAPSPRSKAVAIWTGTEMLLWGGVENGGTTLSNGARYNPTTDTWAPMNQNGAPQARADHSAVWTGTEMIVWGGFTAAGNDPSASVGNGARYNPVTDQWTPLPTEGAPPAAAEPAMVWTGQEVIIWGGVDYGIRNESGQVLTLGVGARFDAGANVWRAMSVNGAPIGRSAFGAVWTSQEMIVWGGSNTDNGNVPLNDGSRYNPATDTWVPLTNDNPPAPRANHTLVWTGQAALVFGGFGGGDLNSNYAWTPDRGLFLYQRP
jgi:N-acetylneuraminic acid mutarotase